MKKYLIFIFITVFLISVNPKQKRKKLGVKYAKCIDKNKLLVKFSGLPKKINNIYFEISEGIKILTKERKGSYIFFTVDKNFILKKQYFFFYRYKDQDKLHKKEIDLDYLYQLALNKIYSNKKLGLIYKNNEFIFRYFVPRGKKVQLVIFDKYDDEVGKIYDMKNLGDQVFEARIKDDLWGKYYGYKILKKSYTKDRVTIKPTMDENTIIADPYSKIVATNNIYPQKGRTLIYDTSQFDWQNDKPLQQDISDLVIMEMHIRDITAHKTSGTKHNGTYIGMIDAKVGGINYLKKLGINAVELMPMHDFNNVEAPYNVKSHGFRNTWNVYARNHWGYMTSYYFAPETYYATDGTMQSDKWNGTDGRAINEFKALVRELHKNGISVILDVVYNHVSQYDENPLKYTDWDFYFKPESKTGCGQEVESRRPMVRRMIIDSLKYWMEEYHIDGFRFDLATAFDVDTVKAIKEETAKINPKVILIAEPWGGEGKTTKNDFIKAGWSIWNDGIRNAIRGGNNRPNKKGESFMLGKENAKGLAKYWQGISRGEAWQSINYIESHDDSTLGDILRILSGTYNYKNKVTNIKKYTQFSSKLLKASKVGAVALFLCQGPIMMHLGQEWGRGKVTPDLQGNPPELLIDNSSNRLEYLKPTPNSYSADNETNYINYDLISLNKSLLEYYRGLIALRKQESLLGNAKPEQIKILKNDNKSSLGVIIDNRIYGFVNSNIRKSATYSIPEGKYSVVVNDKSAGTKELEVIAGGEITIKPSSSLILIKKQ